MRIPGLLCLWAGTLLAGCSEIPEVDPGFDLAAERGGYPSLLPMEEILARAPPPVAREGEAARSVQERAERLRQRAEALDRPIMDSAARDRLQGAIDGGP